jgi:cold shock CspA family protein
LPDLRRWEVEIDSACEVAAAIIAEARARIEAIRSEEDAKLQIITRLLTEVLGWSHADIASESPNENGFSDYLVSDGGRSAFVVEAKKVGEIRIATESTTSGNYKLSGPVLKPATTGIKQVASYCHPLGVPLSVLTDGVRWIVFLPWVPQANYIDKQAIVFPGFDAVLADFPMFYELLSKSEARKGTFRVIFDRVHENRLVLDRQLVAPVSAADNELLQKSALAFDLENVFANFFAGMTGDREPDMLIDCFVETRESRIADFSLEKITKNVLGNINPADKGIEEGLQAIVQSTVLGEAGQTVFIVGPSGAGKSTFLERFFARTLSSDIRERCIVIGINALDASGDEAVAIRWMTNTAIRSIEEELFADGFPEWNELQALYHTEYLRRLKGVDAALYRRSKDEFKEKFSTYVEKQVEDDREGYLRRLLTDIVHNRKKLPIFVIDNTDEFTLSYKTAIFQYFQSLRRAVEHCLLIFPATDRSAWAFSKTEIFNIYASRSFFLPTPSPREVFRKRVDYIKAKLGAPSERQSAAYFAGRGIKVTIRDLGAFAGVVERVFVDQDYAAKRAGELANYNMRDTLRLSKRVITSSILNIEDLIRSYITGDLVAPSPEKFMNALIRGDYQYYRAGDEPLIFPLFQVDSAIKQSPLMNLRILVLLRDLHKAAQEDVERYIAVESLFSYFGVMSVAETAVQRSLESLLAAGLIEPYDLSMKDYSDTQRLAITHSGLAHVDIGCFNPVFFEQMALTTRIVDADVAATLRGAFFGKKNLNARLEEVREIFCTYVVAEDQRICLVPKKQEFASQLALTVDLEHQWKVMKSSAEDMLHLPEVAAQNVSAIVERFDHVKGFGFVDVGSLRDSAFLHARILEQGGFQDVYDGDEIKCDIARNDKGLTVARVLAVSAAPGKSVRAPVVKLFEERGYGFVHVSETAADAFFHFYMLTPEQRENIAEGQVLDVEVTTDKQGRSQVRRVFA